MPVELSDANLGLSPSDFTEQFSSRPERSLSGVGCRPTTVASRYEAVEKVILTMRKRWYEPMSLQAMAEIALLSPYHFNRVFRLITGIPPGRYLAALRMEAAKRLLITTQFTVSDVCFGVGYNSLGSFSRDFTEAVGLSPRNLRRLSQSTLMPWLERLRDYDVDSCYAASDSGLSGQISAPDDFDGLIFIGLFTTPIPQGRPVACTLLPAPGPYRIAHIPRGTYYVFAAAFPRSEEPLAYLLPDPAKMYVGGGYEPLHVHGATVSGDADLSLRALHLADPPILVALPLLMAECLSDHSV